MGEDIIIEQGATQEPEPQGAQPDNANNAYETIISQQQAQIDALIAQSNALTNQITSLIQNGAQLGATAPNAQPEPQNANAFNPKSLTETDAFLSMEDLAKDIGKR